MTAAAPLRLLLPHRHTAGLAGGLYTATFAVCKPPVNATTHAETASAARVAGSVKARLTPALPPSLHWRWRWRWRWRCRASSSSAAHTYGQDEEEEEEEEEEFKGGGGLDARRLYVGNLPYSMTSSQLAGVFGEAGKVENVELVYDRVTDRSRGFAFVTMANSSQAREAIRMFDGALVGGRTVKVNIPEVPRGGEREVMGPRLHGRQSFVDSRHKVYAGNLGWAVTSDSLADSFADQPGVLGARVIYDRDSGRSRGYGFVSFTSPEEAKNAIDAMDGVVVEGRPLRLNLAGEKRIAVADTWQAPQMPEAQTETDDPQGSTMQSPGLLATTTE